jgi:ribosomal protein S18 acetylase RimI-like enzyme
MSAPRILEATSPADYVAARTLFEEYAQAIGGETCFTGFAAELERLPSLYGPPRGTLLLAWGDDAPLGCVAVRTLQPGVCEMKRLYVRPEARGANLGRALAMAAIRWGRDGGYRTLVLDTLASMVAAQSLYRSLEFATRDAYYADPQPGVTFMEKSLQE